MGRAPHDEAEAQAVLDAHVAELRARSYESLRKIMGEVKRRYFGGRLQFIEGGGGELSDAVAASGARYHLHTDAWWDGEDGGDIRVVVELQEDAPPYGELHTDFIIAPNGTFVGE